MKKHRTNSPSKTRHFIASRWHAMCRSVQDVVGRSLAKDVFFADIAPTASLISLRFHSPVLETSWRRAAVEKELTHVRASMILGILLVAAFTPLDYLHIPANDITAVVTMRWGVIIPTILIVLAFSFHKRFADFATYSILAALAVVGASWPVMVFVVGPPAAAYLFSAVIQTILFAFFLLGLPFVAAAAFSWSAVAIFIGVLVITDVPNNPALVAGSSVLVCSAISTFAAYKIELVSRTLFYRTRLLQRETENRETIEAQRISWLEMVARFLRHELRNTTVGVKLSLENIRRKSDDERVGIYLERAETALSFMNNLLNMVAEATSLEVAIYACQKTPVSLNGLIDRQMPLYKDQYGKGTVVFDCVVEAVVDGNEERLVQLLNNLVANAYDHAAPGTTVNIQLETGEGDMALLRVINRGSQLPDDKDDIFELFVSGREAGVTPNENIGLGLYLVRLIAEYHGARAWAQDNRAEQFVEFVVAFPVGEAG